MNDEIREALANEILSELQNLESLQQGSKEHTTAVENVAKLYRLGVDDAKADNDYDEKWNRRELDSQHEQHELERQTREEQFRKEQLAGQRIDRYLQFGLGVGGLILPLWFYGVWMKRGFKFEEKGTYTSTTFRGLFNKFRPTGK